MRRSGCIFLLLVSATLLTQNALASNPATRPHRAPLYTCTAQAGNAQSARSSEPSPDPEVCVGASFGHKVRRTALFPFEIPALVLRAAMWPASAGLSWLQRSGVLARFDRLLSNTSGTFWIYPIIELSPGVGFGGGLGAKGVDFFRKGYFLDADYRIHVDMNQYADFRFGKKDAFSVVGTPLLFEVDASWRWLLGLTFYGIGNDSSQSNQSSFDEQDVDGAVKLSMSLPHDLTISALAGTSATSSGNASNSGITPQVNQQRGYGRWLPYARMGGGIARDTRDIKLFPNRGGAQSLEVNRYQYVGSGAYSYTEFKLLALHNIQLTPYGHVLMLRTAWRLHQPDSSSVVPFDRMAMLDVDHWLRGFDRARFIDRASAVFNTEYHFPIARGLRGMFLFDTGRVFPGLTGFRFASFKYSAGAGFDMHISRTINARLRAAYGGEGVKFIFSMQGLE